MPALGQKLVYTGTKTRKVSVYLEPETVESLLGMRKGTESMSDIIRHAVSGHIERSLNKSDRRTYKKASGNRAAKKK